MTGMASSKAYSIIVIIILIFLTAIWIQTVGISLTGLTQSIGYTFCHQNPERSPFAGTMQFAFCFRCTGLFSGILFALLWQIPFRKSGKIFSKPIIIFLILSILFYFFDSFNASFLSDLLGIQPFYEDQEWIRFISGYLLGSALSILVFSIFARLFYKQPSEYLSTFQRRWQIGGMVLTSVLGTWVLFSDWTFGKQILNILCVISSVIFPMLLYSIIILIVTKNEEKFEKLLQGKNILLSGLLCTYLQIGGLMFSRFRLTGSWGWPF